MFDTEKFIDEVKMRPALYDIHCKERKIKAKCWSEIGEAMYKGWNEMTVEDRDKKNFAVGKKLVKKWKAIRDSFVREFRCLKNAEPVLKKKKYVYFDQLQFLILQLEASKHTQSSIPSADKSSVAKKLTEHKFEKKELQDTETHSFRDVIENRKKSNNQERLQKNEVIENIVAEKTKHLKEALPKKVSPQRKEKSSDKYGNKAFLLSFVPIMDSLPQHISLQARLKITKMFNEMVMCSMSSNNNSLVISQCSPSEVSPSTVGSISSTQSEHCMF